MIKEFLRGSVRVHVLYHASKERVYGVALLKELRRHGYRLSPGMLYPLLHRMERERLLSCEREIVRGKIRKYYAATPKGKRALEQAKEKIRELVEEVLEEKAQ
ncbi:helix-turn-helix transcriptional regulator [Candidatus Poribacteria bacterium]|nr:helix-turn-helix transcriptional regulator [Candidatus Poribacteria bacterium]